MNTPTLIVGYIAGEAIDPYLIVAAGNAARTVNVATAGTEPLIGAANAMGAAKAGDMVDVPKAGHAEVCAGGAFDFGDPLTSDANGKAVKAVPVAGEIVRIIGFAESDAVENDVVPYAIALGLLSTPAA